MARFKLSLDTKDKILLKRSLNKNGNAQKFFTAEVKRLSDPYVPFQRGGLKGSVVMSPTRITYIQSYARTQYYGNRGRGIQGISLGGLRGKHWDKRMMADRGKEIVNSVAKYVGGTAK